MRCRDVGETVSPGDEVTEVTGVGTPTRELFVAYRQADASGHAGRIGENLISHFGIGEVFKDVESLAPGEDFRKVVRDRLQSAFAMIVVIGPRWLEGNRLSLDDDFHREEIVTALNRGIYLVPVLVNGAAIPKQNDLPKDVQPLFDRQALEITDSRWSYDVGRLIEKLDIVLVESPARKRFLAQVPPWGSQGWQWVADRPSEQDVDWHRKQGNGQ
jgi:hypothetical protein